MALQIRKLNFPISAKSLEAVVACSPCQCGNWAVNRARTGSVTLSSRFSPAFVSPFDDLLHQKHLPRAAESSEAPGLLLCLFSFMPYYLERDLHPRAESTWLCAVSQSFGAEWGGEAQPGAPLGWRARSWAEHGTSDRRLCTPKAAWAALCHWLQVLCAAGEISPGNRGTEGRFWSESQHKLNIKGKWMFEQAPGVLEQSHRMHSAVAQGGGWSRGAFVGQHSLLPSRCNLKTAEGEMADAWRTYVQVRSVLFRCPGIFVFWNVFLRRSSLKRKSKALPNNMLFDFTSNL